ncbi:branched-chain amino acid transport system II carrier protein [Alteribacillus bidgolensis]|uniref:branched-chain amino acid transport system II carrier protein n=1 Tax=Alteribacillus bidgolensis TaxID=930129 RepID=UPI003F5D4884
MSRTYSKVSYSTWVYILVLVSLIITNFGLNTILDFASPIFLLTALSYCDHTKRSRLSK